MRHATIGIALVASLLAFAPAASALYIVTPLRAHVDDPAVDVGDAVNVTIEPQNETEAARWAGKLVRAYYEYDAAENASGEPDAPTSSETYRRVPIDDAIALDDRAHGTLAWTVPAEVDDKNVVLRIESADGELLAIVDLAVGDAPPIMRILAGSNDGAPEPATPPVDEAQEDTVTNDDRTSEVPAAGALAALAVLGVAALAMRRRG